MKPVAGVAVNIVFLGDIFRKVLVLQSALTGVVAVIAWLSSGWWEAGSAVTGGAIVMLSSLAYAWVVRPRGVSVRSGNAVLMQHLMAELAKLVLLLGLMVAAFASQRFAAGWLVSGLACAVAGHWLAMLVYKKK